MSDADVGRVQSALAQFLVNADDSGVDEKSYTYCYWKKPAVKKNGEPAPDAGYITYGPAWPTEFKRMQKKGMKPLDGYGEFYFPYDKRYAWRVTADPYWSLFHQGGAKEFPLRQIIEHGWDRKPPYADIDFPQLEGYEPPNEVACPLCLHKFPRLPEAERLLQTHMQVFHKDQAHSQGLADALAKSLPKATESGGPMADVLAVIAQGLQMMAQSQAALAERQRVQDERITQLLEVLAAKNEPSPAPVAPEIPAEIPAVEAGPIEFVAPGAPDEEAAPAPEAEQPKKRAR